MHKVITSVIISLTVLAGCSSDTAYGPCIGIVDEGDPSLVYELSGWNTAWSFIGIELLIPPILWATDYARCPVRRRPQPPIEVVVKVEQ